MHLQKLLLSGGCMILLSACQTVTNEESKPAIVNVQRGQGLPFEVIGSQVWDIADPASSRTYQIYVSLPSSYNRNNDKKYPVLYVTDANYAFPIINQIRRRVNGLEDFILVGLSYNKGEDGGLSRRRDYTPTTKGAVDAPPKAIYGGALHYMEYIKSQVIPFVENKYRTEPSRRIYAGHSYGGLFGANILLNEPSLFSGYILGSPSLWYDSRYTFKREEEYYKNNKDLNANVFMFIGEYEQAGLGDPKDLNRYNMVTDTNDFEKILIERKYPSLKIKSEILNDEDHNTIAPRGFTHALKYFFGINTNK